MSPATDDALRENRVEMLARALPFALYVGFLAVGSIVAEQLPDPRWSYAIQIALVTAALVFFARRYRELWSASELPTMRWTLISVVVGAIVFVVWINLDVPFLAIGDAKGFDPSRGDGSLDPALVALRIAGAALVVPVMEELFWRSLVLRWIDRTTFLTLAPAAVSLRALLMSSLVFGLEHNLWFAGLLAGLAYGYLYQRSGSLWTAVIAHAVTNLMLGVWVVLTGNWQFWYQSARFSPARHRRPRAPACR